jgi:tetratricopeptide (TPR) repeat protein
MRPPPAHFSPVRIVLALTLAGPAAAQHPAGHRTAPTAADSARIPLHRDILGTFAWPVATAVAEAQAYFNQGVRLMYAFTPADARLSFEEARRRDPNCAMCWWGEAWAMGPYLNGPMAARDAPAAHEAARQAHRLARAGTSPVEQALTEAMTRRYAPEHPAGGRKSLDSAFATAMAGVYAAHPDHLEAATLYADALMLLEPRRGTWPLAKPAVARIHEVLEGVLARDLAHPGACHLYIHATETTPKVGLAQPCADLLGNALPGASHLNHMPSHTYNRVGRWGDATRANLQAWHSDQKAARGEGFAIYPAHNLHMLLYSAAVDGQSGIAIQAARDYTKLVPADGASFRALVLLRFGRFDEVLELTRPPEHPIHHGLWAFARGHAHLRLHRPDSARAYLSLVDSLVLHTPATQTFRVHQPAALLGIVAGLLRGELLRTEGQTDAAVAAFEAAILLEDGLTYDEPEPLPFTARDWLGTLLLEAARPAEAERVFREALVRRPHNGWSLLGVAQALRAQGRTAEADAAQQSFERAWARSDTWLPAPRF